MNDEDDLTIDIDDEEYEIEEDEEYEINSRALIAQSRDARIITKDDDEVWSDKYYWIKEEFPDPEYRMTNDTGRGTRNDWDWLQQVRSWFPVKVGRGDQIKSNWITQICKKRNKEMFQPVTAKLRRCWRRGWIRRFSGTHPKSKYKRQSRSVWYILEPIPTSKFGTKRIWYDE